MKITKAAILFFRDLNKQKEVMFVRAGNKPYFVLPGGKLEPDESPETALERELREELDIKAENVTYLGAILGHTPDGRIIEEHIFLGAFSGEPKPQAEIAEIAWFLKDDILNRSNVMTPLTLEKLIPFIDNRDLW